MNIGGFTCITQAQLDGHNCIVRIESSMVQASAPNIVADEQNMVALTIEVARTSILLMTLIVVVCLLALCSLSLSLATEEEPEEEGDSLAANSSTRRLGVPINEGGKRQRRRDHFAHMLISVVRPYNCIASDCRLLAAEKRHLVFFIKEYHATIADPDLPPRKGSNCPTSAGNIKVTDDSVEMGTICLEQFLDGDEIITSQDEHCNHHFHFVCAFIRLLRSEYCPCCCRNYVGKREKAKPRTTQPGGLWL